MNAYLASRAGRVQDVERIRREYRHRICEGSGSHDVVPVHVSARLQVEAADVALEDDALGRLPARALERSADHGFVVDDPLGLNAAAGGDHDLRSVKSHVSSSPVDRES